MSAHPLAAAPVGSICEVDFPITRGEHVGVMLASSFGPGENPANVGCETKKTVRAARGPGRFQHAEEYRPVRDGADHDGHVARYRTLLASPGRQAGG